MEGNENFIHNEYGYCYYCVCSNCAMIYNLYVEPEFRKKGHATHLIKLTIEEIKKTGYSQEIGVEVEPRENSISVENLSTFYKKMGLTILSIK